jgi:hypothetical protein
LVGPDTFFEKVKIKIYHSVIECNPEGIRGCGRPKLPGDEQYSRMWIILCRALKFRQVPSEMEALGRQSMFLMEFGGKVK